MSRLPKDDPPAGLDLASLAATLDDIANSFRQIPHLTQVADTLGKAVSQLEAAKQQSMGTIPDPSEADRRRRGYPN